MASVQEIFRIIHELADALQKQLIPGDCVGLIHQTKQDLGPLPSNVLLRLLLVKLSLIHEVLPSTLCSAIRVR